MLVNIKYEQYYVYFYILSFFVLITIMYTYKKTRLLNKIVIYIAFVILCIQLFIIYNTYPQMEHIDLLGKHSTNKAV